MVWGIGRVVVKVEGSTVFEGVIFLQNFRMSVGVTIRFPGTLLLFTGLVPLNLNFR